MEAFDLEIVNQINQRQRYRNYACTDFLDCFVGEDILFQNQNMKFKNRLDRDIENFSISNKQ